jgi:hypothetical protein
MNLAEKIVATWAVLWVAAFWLFGKRPPRAAAATPPEPDRVAADVDRMAAVAEVLRAPQRDQARLAAQHELPMDRLLALPAPQQAEHAAMLEHLVEVRRPR